ncbi:uncharacterized protein LOC126840744 [Adelges cooleyi]|uniref:uncharacterized protein LOC126840744 n=1 Tax=Adelges cooleyi TaxID=133065 RepID=UPI00217F3A68|nr:uncharacterized protein LOC126840744 [Adelges cooleyi]
MTNIDRCYNYVRPFPFTNDLEPTKEGASSDSGTLHNVVDLVMGQDGILWVLDVGISETLSDRPTRENEAKVVGFDVATGKAKHLIPLHNLTCRLKSRLQFMVVEYRKDTVAVYVGDGGTRSIIVWYVRNGEGFRVKMPYSTVLGCRESREMDVFYIALIEQCTGNYIYFTYLSSPDVFRVRTKDLRKRINPKCLVNIGRKPCRMVFVGVGYETVLYFRIKGQNHLYGWDAKTSFLEENFMLVRKSKDCRTITHVDVDNAGILWALESNIQDFLMGNVGCFGPNMMLSPVLDKPTPVNECDSANDGP